MYRVTVLLIRYDKETRQQEDISVSKYFPRCWRTARTRKTQQKCATSREIEESKQEHGMFLCAQTQTLDKNHKMREVLLWCKNSRKISHSKFQRLYFAITAGQWVGDIPTHLLDLAKHGFGMSVYSIHTHTHITLHVCQFTIDTTLRTKIYILYNLMHVVVRIEHTHYVYRNKQDNVRSPYRDHHSHRHRIRTAS